MKSLKWGETCRVSKIQIQEARESRDTVVSWSGTLTRTCRVWNQWKEKYFVHDVDKPAHKLISSPLCVFSQGSTIARQMGAVAYVECTSKVSENSVRDVFHITTVASVRRPHKPQLKRSSSRRGLKRVSQLPLPPLPGRTEQMDQAPAMRKDRAKSCVLM